MVAQFVVGGAEAGRCLERADATQGGVPLLEASVVLLHTE